MKKHRAFFLIVLAAMIQALAYHPTLAQDQYRFDLGFKTMADLLAGSVGDPVGPLQYQANGDALQRTSGGLLVWRKADNWTAFTDGYMTWVNGPYGIETRLNTSRFSWEHDHSAGPAKIEDPGSQAEQEAFSLINQSRQEHGLLPLTMDDSIRQAARLHAEDMAARGYFAHVNPEGQEPWDRMRAAGVRMATSGENLGWGGGFSIPTAAVRVYHEMMMAEVPPDDGHLKNILDPRFARIGIGVAQSAEGKFYYVTDFAN